MPRVGVWQMLKIGPVQDSAIEIEQAIIMIINYDWTTLIITKEVLELFFIQSFVFWTGLYKDVICTDLN